MRVRGHLQEPEPLRPPHPARGFAACHLLPARGEKETSQRSATPLPRCRGAPSPSFLRLSQERGSGAPNGAPKLCSPCEGEPAALAIGPLANRRSTAVFCQYRAVLPNRTGTVGTLIRARYYARPS